MMPFMKDDGGRAAANDVATPTHAEFVDLLKRCIAQVEMDRSGYTNNPHVYNVLDRIHLRLCHGNREEGDSP